MDEIKLTNMVFFGTHGVNPEETVLGQRFGVNMSVWMDLGEAARTDDLDSTVSYAKLYKLARGEVEGTPSKLLEHLAGRIIARAFEHDPRIQRVRVEVSKPSPPIKGSTTVEVSVVLERARGEIYGR